MKLEDTFLPDDGTCPPCRLCDDPVACDESGQPFDLCAACLDVAVGERGAA